MIKFYFHHTPNPMKVALFLEETALPYQLASVDIFKGEQHNPAFRAVNPNGKVPAIEYDGVRVFDSNAILLYLGDTTGQFIGQAENRGELLSWLMFVATGLGPFSGQSVYFKHYASEKLPYAINRYNREVKRHYEVLDQHLNNQDYLAGDEYTIADMAAWGWIDRAPGVLGDGALEDYPNLKHWFERVDSRPAVSRARQVGKDLTLKTEMDEDALHAMFPQNYAVA